MSSDLKDKAIHDLHEEDLTEVDWDEDDVEDVMHRVHYTLTRALDIQQPKWLHNEVASLLKTVDLYISWSKIH